MNENKKLFEFIKTDAGLQFNAVPATNNEYLTAILVLTQNLVANKPQLTEKVTLNNVIKMLRSHLRTDKLSS